MSALFRLSAVGDICFEGTEADNPSIDCFEDVIRIFHQSDLVIGNLECPLLPKEKGEALLGKCILRGSPDWAAMMKNSGIGLVSLANNHIMDYGKPGLFSTIEILERTKIYHVGAGRNRHEACAPVHLNITGVKVAFLARSAVVVDAPTYAGDNEPGVAFLDVEETLAAIRATRPQADLVILLIHWGLEEYCYPSPSQQRLARQFVNAGADVILGHHPHVLQGLEYYRSALIAYSLGNFLFSDFEWTYRSPQGVESNQLSLLSSENRKGLIATFEWSETEKPILVTIPTKITPYGRVRLDLEPARKVELAKLSTGINKKGYRYWWRGYAFYREWNLRLGQRFSFKKVIANLSRLRLQHLIEFIGLLCRSVRIVAEKSTNPYE